jgi:hypothetical protein
MLAPKELIGDLLARLAAISARLPILLGMQSFLLVMD